ncbi:intercellular trafficking and secretion [Nowakowskiella sp. JEL0078]|nr:intercellular trafficking and secretion [Nowakowskiella sp. JEL0078]
MEFTDQQYSDMQWDPLHNGSSFPNALDNSSHFNTNVAAVDHSSDSLSHAECLRLVPGDIMKIEVSDPQRHGEGNGSFVTYLVTTKVMCVLCGYFLTSFVPIIIQTVLDSFRVPEMSLRRRFQDFDWLHKSLLDEIPACILPSLPDKHRIEYLAGDRFSPEFIEKRRLSLEQYMNRLSRHPTIQKTNTLKKFLEVSDLRFDREMRKRENHVLENISDTLMNAFTKLQNPDDTFINAKTNVDKFEFNLVIVEKLQSRLLKQQADLEKDFLELSDGINALGQMETQISKPLNEFGETMQRMCVNMKEKKNREDSQFFSKIREYIVYCQNLKDVLRLRDQKQLDFEELTQVLKNTQEDKEKTSNPARYNRGLGAFIKERYHEIQGIDAEIARKTKLERLERKVNELQEAVDASREISDTFSREGLALWDEIIPALESMRTVLE